MKKLLLVTLLALFGIQMRAAVQFDELDLLGGWELQSCTGTYPFFTSRDDVIGDLDIALSECKYLYFGDLLTDIDGEGIAYNLPGYTRPIEINQDSCNGLFYIEESKKSDTSEKLEDEECLNLTDFFISNGNKLHIQFEYFAALHFVIESMDASEMHLRSFDGKCKVVYKRLGNSSVNAIAAEDSDLESTFYTLNGIATSNPSHGIYVEKNGAKAKKVLKK